MVNKRAFTMIELVFVIVILGILAGIAIPKLTATRDDAIIAKAKATIASIKSGIASTKSANMLSGNFSYPAELNNTANTGVTSDRLFGNVLGEGVIASDTNGWMRNSTLSPEAYEFILNGDSKATFTYSKSDGNFTCKEQPVANGYCTILTK
jgi:general secretion pathway protein G